MKNIITILKILIIFLLISQNCFAANPIPGIGIVIKKNNCLPNPCKSTCNHGGAITLTTTTSGVFSMQLEVGEYELSFPQDQLQSVIGKLIKRNYPKSTFQYDGSGVELTLDNPQIRVQLKPVRDNIYTINEQNSSFIIIVPAGGATLSGILSWNDAVLTNSEIDSGLYKTDGQAKSNPYFKNNSNSGEMVPMNRSVKGNTTGTLHITKDEKRLKGMQENGLKNNEIENVANDADVKAIAETMVNRKSINNINGGMPNRISMNVNVAKQTQGATFGEKVNSGKINVTLVEGGCVVLFPSNEGYRVTTSERSINELSRNECQAFGEKVNQGLHAAGSALSQGASLLGGALPGGAIISAAVSSVGNLAGGAGGGAAAASYARTGKMTKADSGKTVQKIQDEENNATLELQDGEYELVFVIVEKATSGLKDTLKTQVRIGFTLENGLLKTKQYTGHVTLMK